MRRIRRTLSRDEGEDLILRAYMSEDFREGHGRVPQQAHAELEGQIASLSRERLHESAGFRRARAFLRTSHSHAKVIRSEVAVRLELAAHYPAQWSNGQAPNLSKYNKDIGKKHVGHILKAAAALTAMIASAPAFAAWEPTKPVEIVVAAGAGGASDQMARMMQAAIQKNNLMKQPMVVSLKGGASGAEALMYMKSSDGDPNKVLIAYSLIYMLPLSAKIPFNWRDLTPVSVVALDQFVLWDNAAGPKTVKEFIAAAKAASSPFKMGGTGSKREDHVLTVFMEQKTGAKFSYLPYKSGGEAATQLVGKHTESNVNNPSENLEVWRAGQVRALCVFDKERISYKTKVTETQSWNDIPTCKEEGLDVQYLMLRAMFLPGKVTPEQQAFYVDLFQKVTQTPEYKDYMEKQALKPIFLTGKDMLKFLEEDDKLNTSLMNEAGFVAK